MRRRFAGTALALTLLTGTAGCSIVNPHVSVDKLPNTDAQTSAEQDYLAAARDRQTKIEKTSPGESFYGDLPGAIDYSNALRQAYYGAVGDQEKLKSGLALTLIPVAAASLYLGLTGGSTDAVAGLATGGAAGFGLGTFFVSEPRERVYLQGSLTLGCAIFRSSPYLVKTRDYDRMSDNLVALAAALAKLRSAIAIVESEAHGNSTSVAAVADGKAAAAAGEQALQDGRALLSKIESAGSVLLVVTDNIRDRVSLEITKTEPDLAAIKAIASGLSPTEQLFAGLGKSTPPKATTISTEAPLGTTAPPPPSLNDLIDDTTQVREEVYNIDPFIQQAAARTKALGSLTDCTPPAEQNPGFEMAPADSTVSIKVNATYSVVITNAIGNASGTIVGGGDPKGLDIATAGAGAGLVLTITAKKEGAYSVVIADGTGKNSRTLAVTVTK